MNKLKAKAGAFAALGLTGFLLALAAGILAATTSDPAIDDDLLSTFYLAGVFGGPLFMALGGMLYDRALRLEEEGAETKQQKGAQV